MTNWFNGEPKIIPCLIIVHEFKTHQKALIWDAIMLQTAAKRYFIAFGLGDVSSNDYIQDIIMEYIIEPSYLWVKIHTNGLASLRCPSITGLTGSHSCAQGKGEREPPF